jgi:signal transduction histidine kinase/CHASE3 domain sensor protein
MAFLKQKLTSAALVSILVISIFTLFFAAGISFRQFQSQAETQQLIVRSYRIYIALEQVNSYSAEAESNLRSFILTRDSTFIDLYNEATGKVKSTFTRLGLLTQENPEQSANLDSLVLLVYQRFYYMDNILNRQDYNSSDSGYIRSILLRGSDIMRQTHAQIDRMIDSELAFLKRHEEEHSKDINLSPFSILFMVLFSLTIFSFSFYRINKDVKGLAQKNNQLMINNEIFEHSEQIADISSWYWNIKENKLSYSNNLYRLLGCNVGEFEPTFENFLEFVHPADRQLLIESNLKIIKELFPSVTFFRVIRKDGVLRHFKSIGKIITDTYGTNFSIGINADITEQYYKDKLIEEKIHDLEKSNKQLSAFNHIASHDLQEPLRKVQIFISRIKGREVEAFPEKIRDYLSGIKREANRMQMFITDLLLYSRASKSEKSFEPADLNEILESTKRDLSQRIEEKNVIINSTSNLPTINVIPFQMQQLFDNIISNSIKYSKPGINPVINIKSRIVQGKEIPLPTETTERFYEISFSDNGIGFDQKYAEKIFTLFFRLHSPNDYSGTGIGLAICKIIVENHKGFILAEGIPGIGSTFKIYLPVSSAY